MNRLLIFPTEQSRTSGTGVRKTANNSLYFGKFTAAQCEAIRKRFHEDDETTDKLSREFGVGTSLIQQVIRIKRMPMGSAQQNDRRQVRKVAA